MENNREGRKAVTGSLVVWWAKGKGKFTISGTDGSGYGGSSPILFAHRSYHWILSNVTVSKRTGEASTCSSMSSHSILPASDHFTSNGISESNLRLFTNTLNSQLFSSQKRRGRRWTRTFLPLNQLYLSMLWEICQCGTLTIMIFNLKLLHMPAIYLSWTSQWFVPAGIFKHRWSELLK